MTLNELPNVGKVNAEKLAKAGIATPEELRRLGSREAFLQVRLHSDAGACLHMLYGLEAAVRGIPKNQLPDEEKQALKLFFNQLEGR